MLERIPILGIMASALAPATILSAAISTVLLDALVDRPIAASLTTLFPGMVYTSKTVMQLSIAASLLAGVMTFWCREKFHSGRVPWWTLSSVGSVAFAPLIGGIGVLFFQFLAEGPAGPSMSYIPRVARSSVLVMLVVLAMGLIAGIVALTRRERPVGLSLLSAFTNAAALGMMRYHEFYKLGFDQDRWALPLE